MGIQLAKSYKDKAVKQRKPGRISFCDDINSVDPPTVVKEHSFAYSCIIQISFGRIISRYGLVTMDDEISGVLKFEPFISKFK